MGKIILKNITKCYKIFKTQNDINRNKEKQKEDFKMAKKKMQFFEEMVFDDVQYAVDTFNKSKAKMKKAETGMLFAVIATCCNLIGWMPEWKGIEGNVLTDICVGVGVLCTIIAYIKGGGIGNAFKWTWKISAFCWFIFIFPFDMLAWLVGFGFGLAAFFIVPLIPVFMNYRQIKMDFEAARKYVSYYKAKKPTSQPKAVVNQVKTQTSGSRSYASQTRTQASGSRSSSNQTQERQVRIQTLADGSKIYR